MNQQGHRKAAIWAQPGDTSITLSALPIPTPSPTQILIKIQAASLCHTDTIVPSGIFYTEFPIIAGHEGVGEIVALGAEAGRDGWKVGERVGALLKSGGCGQCGECKYHSKRYCPQASMLGLKGENGVFAEYALVDKDWTVRLPDGLSYEQAAPLTCAGVTIYSAIRKLDLSVGEVLLICGFGGLGKLGVQIAQALGIKVIGSDISQTSLEYLSSLPPKLRPDILVNPHYGKPEDILHRIRGLRQEGYDSLGGADAAIICTDSPLAIPFALPLLRPHSKLLLTAGPMELSFSLMDFIFKDITVMGSLNGTRERLTEVMELCAREGIQSEVHVERWDEGRGVERIMHGQHGVGKGVVRM
ncbi:hypothetical protein I302_101286 [Kwoniella bestiolae CBS 10118]|uniref:Enoyl reductase (ER) domain-containing protein n=1 Tax=Kwoniella bestiolae CBS 10118 TaxID=1296100 RepID=A0AAJ8M596_9TREE